MESWVALLRGVNVGGITVRSADLRQVFESLGLSEVRTVLASGNVAFASEQSVVTLKAAIESGLRERFGYDAWIVLVTRATVAATITAFPFDAEDAGRQPYAIFSSDDESLDRLISAAAGFDADADPLARGRGVIYWNPITGTTVDTPFGKLLSRKEFKETTTSRNLRTLQKIVG